MYCDANGQPDPNGDFQLINGNVCIRDGRRVSFDLMFRDAASTGPRTFSDAKQPDEPTSIDQALAQAFKQSAESAGFKGDVSGWIAKLEPKELDKYVAQVATAFVRGHAGAGVGKHFATDSALEAKLSYKIAAARSQHDMTQGYKAVSERTPFTAQDAAAVVAKEASSRVATFVQQNDSASELERLRSEAAVARVARDYLTANAWRR